MLVSCLGVFFSHVTAFFGLRGAQSSLSKSFSPSDTFASVVEIVEAELDFHLTFSLDLLLVVIRRHTVTLLIIITSRIPLT